MWSLVNRTPYAADRGWVRDQHGAEIWVVSVKATYDIGPDGTVQPSREQMPVLFGPAVDPLSGDLRYETDLGLPKPGTDVILIGCAHSPTGQPITELPIGFRVGSLTRKAAVFGDRQWRKTLLGHAPGDPEPFVTMPLIYSRAWGGDSGALRSAACNPAGCGALNSDGQAGRMPNVEDYEQRLKRPTDQPPVAGFGPVPERWLWRLQHAGTYDDDWFENRRPLLPENVDPRFWRIAPPDQQLQTHLRGGEPVALLNLTRAGYCDQALLQFELPRLSLGFETRFYDGGIQHGRSRIHTVILEPEFPRVSVVHHMSLPCHAKVNLLDRTVVVEKRRPLDTPRAAGAGVVDAALGSERRT